MDAFLWLTCCMRVVASGNLTVELIRAQRFDVACRDQQIDQDHRCTPCKQAQGDTEQHQVDRVELSPQAMASDPWAIDAKRDINSMEPIEAISQHASTEEMIDDPEQISPVVGSPALAGLGAAWVVPGTLLDVVA